MQAIIQITTDEQGSLVVSSLDFAAGLAINHKSLLETIRTHQDVIENDFGLIAFETEAVKKDSPFETANLRSVEKDSPFQTANLDAPKKDSAFQTRNLKRSTKPLTTAYLTEDQALFIGTLSRNSKRVVEFKSTLVRSFAEARKSKQLSTPADSASLQQIDSRLISMQGQINQLQNQINQQEQVHQLRLEVEQLRQGRQLPQPVQPLANGPIQPLGKTLRKAISKLVNEYCGIRGAMQSDTYSYLYKRMFYRFGIDVYRLNRKGGENHLDAIEQNGLLDRLYTIIVEELRFPEE